MEDLLTYETKSRTIIFEPRLEIQLSFIEGKTGLNSLCLDSQVCNDFIFLKENCRVPTAEERKRYEQLKKAHPNFYKCYQKIKGPG